jgi:hypothetical protein
MNWRTWAAEQLRLYVPLTTIIPAKSMYAAGSLTGRPSLVPFLIVDFGTEFIGPYPGASEQEMDVFVHDEPGDFMRIDQVLTYVRQALMGGEDVTTGRVAETNGIAVSWDSDSRDLADDGYKTIYKFASFTLRGVKVHA